MAANRRPKVVRIFSVNSSYSRAIALATFHRIRSAGFRPVIGDQPSPPNAPDYPDEAGFVGFVTGARVEALRARGLPVVNVSQAHAQSEFPSVLPDNRAAGRCAVDHLLRRGYTQIVFAPHGNLLYSRLRGEGARAAATAAGVRYREFPEDFSLTLSKTWEPLLPTLTLPVGIVTGDDGVAVALLEAANVLGIRVPEQLAVVGITNEEIACNTAMVPLSSVDLNPSQIGDQAARLVLRLIAGRRPPAKPILIPPRGVVVRASSDSFATNDPFVAKVIQHVRDHLDKGLWVGDLARQFRISRRHLSRLFHERSGFTLAEMLQRVAVARARQLLADSDLTIAQVAEACGYNHQPHFGALFRKHTGITPAAFREESGWHRDRPSPAAVLEKYRRHK